MCHNIYWHDCKLKLTPQLECFIVLFVTYYSLEWATFIYVFCKMKEKNQHSKNGFWEAEIHQPFFKKIIGVKCMNVLRTSRILALDQKVYTGKQTDTIVLPWLLTWGIKNLATIMMTWWWEARDMQQKNMSFKIFVAVIPYDLWRVQILNIYSRYHTKRVGKALPANPSFGVTTTKILNDTFLQSTPQMRNDGYKNT